jgi:hypothetical protein
MKKLFILVFVLSFLLIPLIFAATDYLSCATGETCIKIYHGGSTIDLTYNSQCHTIKNNHASNDYFIPPITRSADFAAFLSNHPSDISVSNCPISEESSSGESSDSESSGTTTTTSGGGASWGGGENTGTTTPPAEECGAGEYSSGGQCFADTGSSAGAGELQTEEDTATLDETPIDDSVDPEWGYEPTDEEGVPIVEDWTDVEIDDTATLDEGDEVGYVPSSEEAADAILAALDEEEAVDDSSSDEGSSGTSSSSVICTEAHRLGYMSDQFYALDKAYAEDVTNEVIMIGYHSWAKPLVRVIQKDYQLSMKVIPIAVSWSEHAAYMKGITNKDNEVGIIILNTAIPLCEELGNKMIKENMSNYEFNEEFVSKLTKKYIKSNVKEIDVQSFFKELEEELSRQIDAN